MTARILRLLMGIVLVGGLLASRRRQVVKAIRFLDRRGGVFSRHGEAAYAGASRLFAGLHQVAAADAARDTAGARRSIVDIGAGPGDLLAALSAMLPDAILTGIEPSARMRAIASRRGLTEVDGRAELLPLADGSADLVLSTLSAHHWDDPAAAFAEIRRVLRPGGSARIYDVRFAGYGREEAASLAAKAGFAAEAVDHRVLPQRLLGLRPYALISLTA